MADAVHAAGDDGRHPRLPMILALETSCDDTCAAVVTRAGEIRSNVVSSQAVHGRFGGVVPEWASRHHLELVNVIVDQALEEAGASLDDAEMIAVTQGPGLVGALLVGVATAKGLAAGRRLPLAAVDHLQGHVAANFLGGRSRSSRRVGRRLRRTRRSIAPCDALPPSSACWPRAATRCWRGSRSTTATRRSARRSTTRRARRSTRARACSASATRAARRSRSWRRPAIPRRSSSPPAPASRASTSRSPA